MIVPLEPGLRPAVVAYINGQGPFRLLIETGDRIATLQPDVHRRVMAAAPSASLSIGDARHSGLPFAPLAVPQLYDYDGHLGLDVFESLMMTIDFRNRTLRLGRDTLPEANGRDILTFTRLPVTGFLGIPVILPDGSRVAAIDTQSPLSLTGSPGLLGTLDLTTPPVVIGQAVGPGIGTVPLWRARIRSVLRIGDVELHRPIVDAFPFPAWLPPEGFILGLQVLQEFAIAIDQRTDRIRLARTDRRIPSPPTVASLGLSARRLVDGSREVTVAVDGLGAARGGITVGDTIVAVNGRAIASLGSEDWRLVAHGNTPTTFAIRRNGSLRTVEATPVPLF